MRAVCADDALKPVRFQTQSSGTWVTETGDYDYRALTATSPGTNLDAATLTSVRDEVAAFIVRLLPLRASRLRPKLRQRVDDTHPGRGHKVAGSTPFDSAHARVITTHDGFRAAVSGVAERRAAEKRGTLRQILALLGANVAPSQFQNWPASGVADLSFVFTYEVLVRIALPDRRDHHGRRDHARCAFADASNIASIRLQRSDERYRARARDGKGGKELHPSTQATPGPVDFIWMSDTSDSTDDDREHAFRRRAYARRPWLTTIDFRMASSCTRETINARLQAAGTLVGQGYLTPDQMSLFRAISARSTRKAVASSTRGRVERDTQRTPEVVAPDRRSAQATQQRHPAVVYISDEFAQEIRFAGTPAREHGNGLAGPDIYGCDTNVGEYFKQHLSVRLQAPGMRRITQRNLHRSHRRPYIQQIVDLEGIAFARDDSAGEQHHNLHRVRMRSERRQRQRARTRLRRSRRRDRRHDVLAVQ